MFYSRSWHAAVTLFNGSILVCGGIANTDYRASTELYDPVNRRWQSTRAMVHGRA